MKGKRKRQDAGFKARVALEALKGQKTTQQIAAEYDIHPTQVSDWKKTLLEGIGNAFEGRRAGVQEDFEAEREKLHSKNRRLVPLLERNHGVKGKRKRVQRLSRKMGGAGAIDLQMHLCGGDFRTACHVLAEGYRPMSAGLAFPPGKGPEGCRRPFEELAAQYAVPSSGNWPVAREYLVKTRKIDVVLVDEFHEKGVL